MRRLPVILITVLFLFAAALPALAQEGDPLAEATLLPGVLGWVLVGLALLLALLLLLWSARGPN